MAINAAKLKINNKLLQKFADQIAMKYTAQYISAGDKAQKEICRKYTISWYFHDFYTTTDALEFRHEVVHRKDSTAIYFTSYINMGKSAAVPISSFVRLGFQNEWEKTVNKYVKK